MYTPGNKHQATARAFKSVVIKGGAGVKDKFSLATPKGMVTEVTDEELAFLQKDPHFQRHVRKGFMRVMNQEKLNVSDMQPKDHGAQLTDSEHAAMSDTKADIGRDGRSMWAGEIPAGFVR